MQVKAIQDRTRPACHWMRRKDGREKSFREERKPEWEGRAVEKA